MDNLPLSQEIPYIDQANLFQLFSMNAWSFLLDSADSKLQRDDTNRYSYIGFDPFDKIIIKDGQRINHSDSTSNPFQYLKQQLMNFKLAEDPDLPPFQGGAIGYFSYDLCHYLETVNRPIHQENNPYADLAIGIFDTIIAFDHVLEKAWIISTGFPEKDNSRRLTRAKLRLDTCANKIKDAIPHKPENKQNASNIELTSPFNKERYANLVEKAQQYILEGDIFEVNLSHRFEAELNQPDEENYSLYMKMRAANPSPFSAYLNMGDHQILSSSPERFLLCKDRHVSTRPIKGTAPRGKSPTEDEYNAKKLSSSEKDRSENVMIADLLRNDLSKVCLPNSIKVKKLCGLENYPSVFHLVTVIEGVLQNNVHSLDLLEACFPGGSITGAPKIRSMQIIYELEPTARGPYCGSIGYIGFNGAMDTSIVIRTLLAHGNKISYQAGGAVVLDSSPEEEYLETLTKSASIKRVLTCEA